MKHAFVRIILLYVLTVVCIPVSAQVIYSIEVSPELKVEGTSTIHDWEMISNTASGTARITTQKDKLISIDALEVVMPVRSLKSGKGAMDTNTYKALKSDLYPTIIFELMDVEKIDEKQVLAKGKFTISGTKRDANLVVIYEITDDKIQFSGEHAIKFSEFNLDPPTAIFGTIKTGDDLTLSFNVTFKSTTKITKQ